MFRRSPRWDEIACWALDLETTGLDPKRDEVLAVGMVPVRGGAIRIGEAWGTLVRPEAAGAIPLAGMTAHHIVPGEVAGAPTLAAVLPEVLARLHGGVAIVHHAPLDVAFLKAGCRRAGLDWPRIPVIDTVDLLWRRARQRRYASGEEGRDPDLQLSAARRACGLPDYPAHDPVADAIATAELFLVLRHALGAARVHQLT
jgi:DNA polymerase-3 subunit epsilon